MRLSLTETDPRRDLPPDALSGLLPEGHTRGADVTWRMATQPAGPNYVYIGDAATVVDPASSHGVLKGIMSGMMAAHVIIQARAGAVTAAAAAAAYTAWLAEWFHADVKELRRFYRQLPAPPAWVLDDG